ncbi:hypothetical protein SAMD00023353_0203610 [Rosellinia necatrix]|uniref:WSC domain-containing protein n=1 Tax=Rosellinia necatrix TaxID=77044 RepID=A0A1W2TNZ2_ROSNE|nr:hypothetical protein SAMD00023353_0203610 [Rosellinia necatrix]
MPFTSTTTSTSIRSMSTTTPTSIRSTSTATTPTTTAFPTSGLLSLDCPAINGTLEAQNVSSNRYIFEIYCGFDCSGSQGDSDQSFNEFTIDECMNRCATMNAGDGLSSCGGVVWNGNLTSALEQGGNCYLKLGTVTLSSCDGGCPVAAAAKLVGTGEN